MNQRDGEAADRSAAGTDPAGADRSAARTDERPERRGVLAALAVGLVLALAWLTRRPTRPPRPRLPGVDEEDLAAGHEVSDVNVRAIAVAGVGLLVVLAIVFLAVTALEAPYTQGPASLAELPGLTPLPTPELPPAPRLEAEPGEDLGRYRAQQEQRLRGYGWVDRSGGVVRIPIDRAIDLLAQRGLPARPAAEAQQYRDHADSSPSGASSGRVEERTWP
jgi:hypothetical protein